MRFNRTVLSVILYILTVGFLISTAGCVNQETHVPNELTVANISPSVVANISPSVVEKICYENEMTAVTLNERLATCSVMGNGYFVHIDPIADHKEGDVFQITGCTNVPKETPFMGKLTQYDYFTPGIRPISSSIKNITPTPGYNNYIQYFSYEVNSTDFIYSAYTFDIRSVGPHDTRTYVIDWRHFNITHVSFGEIG